MRRWEWGQTAAALWSWDREVAAAARAPLPCPSGSFAPHPTRRWPHSRGKVSAQRGAAPHPAGAWSPESARPPPACALTSTPASCRHPSLLAGCGPIAKGRAPEIGAGALSAGNSIRSRGPRRGWGRGGAVGARAERAAEAGGARRPTPTPTPTPTSAVKASRTVASCGWLGSAGPTPGQLSPLPNTVIARPVAGVGEGALREGCPAGWDCLLAQGLVSREGVASQRRWGGTHSGPGHRWGPSAIVEETASRLDHHCLEDGGGQKGWGSPRVESWAGDWVSGQPPPPNIPLESRLEAIVSEKGLVPPGKS